MIPKPRRRGYAMVAVVLFVTLFLGLWGIAARQIGSMLRIEQARARRVQRDNVNLPTTRALAQAMAALAIGFPPSSPFTRMVYVDGSPFAVTFTRNPEGDNPDEWSVLAAPNSDTLSPLDAGEFQPMPPTTSP